MFRRRSTSNEPAPTGSLSAPEETDSTRPKGYTPKKGVRTPKRRESENYQRRPLNAPQSWRESVKRNRELRKKETQRQREAYAKGDERYYRPQDRGKVRAYARDFVDSRRMISEFFLFFSIIIIGAMLFPTPEVQIIVSYVLFPTMMITIVLEGIWLSRQVKKRAAILYPEESVRGAGWYAAMRMLQIRKLRLPKPELRPGDDPDIRKR
ncbi:DUF3043 domain-containing protein [Spiractinospora alimapuensis]|uniref:DUF3043 domain-containing protein n=1 Tax=Spiractinospora alimapuensis TaxID=2820884 RepID=UPI001F17337A|nr:DUF3043 domain-containing protein [Spiractinospora alimapuensis]QVQ53253.1 DUF3043 domain-containing protein [Spiractinospora alimapuensis]